MSDPRMTGTKTCSHCKRELPVICFAVEKRSKDGLHSRCRDCLTKDSKKYYKPRRPKTFGMDDL